MTSEKTNVRDKFSLFLLATLPITAILGNFAINLYLFFILLSFFTSKVRINELIKDTNFKILFIFYLYLCLNSFWNFFKEPSYGYEGIIRSIFFIKFILLFKAIPLLLKNEEILKKTFKIWLLIIVIVLVDVFFEKINGFNLIGFKSPDTTRITSFFYNENVVGTFLFSFGFITIAFFLKDDLTNKSKILFNCLIVLILISVLISGERSSFLKSLLFFFIIYLVIQEKKLVVSKLKSYLIITTLILITILTLPSVFIKQTEFFKRILNVQNPVSFYQRFENIRYFSHYDVAMEIFKDFPLTGIGNKNFRIKCSDEIYFKEKIKFSNTRCSTHPHQIHFELLAEQGMIGYIIFFVFIINYFRTKIPKDLKSQNIFRISLSFYILIFLIPILPSGSLFATFNGLLFWFILGLSNLKFRH